MAVGLSSARGWKDTVLVTVLCVLLHPLQVLLMTFETPGIVFDLWYHVGLLQAEVENILWLLHLISVVTAKVTTQGKRYRVGWGSASQIQKTTMWGDVPLPHNLVFLAAVPRSLLAVDVIFHVQRRVLLMAPLQYLALGLAVCRGVLVLQVAWLAAKWIGDEAQVPLLILFKTHRHNTWDWVKNHLS